MLRGMWNWIETRYVYKGCQKSTTQKWLSMLIWNFQEIIKEMINWPSTQYFHAATTTTTTSTAAATTATTKTTAYTGSNSKAEEMDMNI